jgi:hypothetical protein
MLLTTVNSAATTIISQGWRVHAVTIKAIRDLNISYAFQRWGGETVRRTIELSEPSGYSMR